MGLALWHELTSCPQPWNQWKIALCVRRYRLKQKKLPQDYPSLQEDGSHLSDSRVTLQLQRTGTEQQPTETQSRCSRTDRAIMPSGSLKRHSDYRICHTNRDTSVSKAIIVWATGNQLICSGRARVNGSLPEHTNRHYLMSCIFVISSPLPPSSEAFILKNDQY